MLTRRVFETFSGKRTVDTKFDDLSAKLLSLERKIKGFSRVVQQTLRDLKAFHQTSLNAAIDMCAYYEDGKNEPMKLCLDKLQEMEKDTIDTKYTLLVKTVEQRITIALKNFNDEIQKVRKRIKERDDCRLQYDHYTVKFEKLTKEREKIVSNGQLATWKNKDKFERNEGKLNAAKIRYEQINTEVFTEMSLLFNNRFVHINNFCSSFIKMKMFYFSAYGKQCASFQAPLKEALRRTAIEAKMANARISSPEKFDDKPKVNTEAANKAKDDFTFDSPASPEKPKIPARPVPKAKGKKARKPKPAKQSHNRSRTRSNNEINFDDFTFSSK
mmetsp:Transcript_10838/g.16149  ORF Transcript_10838/g.16149 Transcript_10838/m.16149 type:complete len:329 (+) Transcript_10838:56-1042(+)